MFRKNLPVNEVALGLLFTVCRDFLNYMEPVLRLLNQQWRGIGSAILEMEPTRAFRKQVLEVQKAHTASAYQTR